MFDIKNKKCFKTFEGEAVRVQRSNMKFHVPSLSITARKKEISISIEMPKSSIIFKDSLN